MKIDTYSHAQYKQKPKRCKDKIAARRVINESTRVMNKKHIENRRMGTYNGTYKRWYP